MAASKTPNISFMKSCVNKFIKGHVERWEFDLDFDHHIIKRYDKMLREDRDFAEAFAFYISERGVDVGRGLDDDEYRSLIHDQYQELLAVAKEGYL